MKYIKNIIIKIIKIIIPYLFITDKIIFLHRIAKLFYNKKMYLLSNLIENKILIKYNCHIRSHAQIGRNIKFPHPIGIVIGFGSIIGDNVHIYQNVTLGAKDINNCDYPIIHDNVTIYANSTIIGDVNIGEGSIIGANSLVLNNVEPHSINYGCPARKKSPPARKYVTRVIKIKYFMLNIPIKTTVEGAYYAPSTVGLR